MHGHAYIDPICIPLGISWHAAGCGAPHAARHVAGCGAPHTVHHNSGHTAPHAARHNAGHATHHATHPAATVARYIFWLLFVKYRIARKFHEV